MLREIKGTQRQSRMLGLRIDGTGTAAVSEGASDVTLVDNGTGDYSLTFARPFMRIPAFAVAVKTADAIAVVPLADASVSAFKVLGFDATDGTTAKDIEFDVIVLGWDAADAV